MRATVILFGVAVATSASPARAGCGVSRAFAFAPENGAALPPNPTVWVFLRDRLGQPRATLDELTVTDERDLPVSATRTDLATEGPYRVVQLHVAAASGTVIVRGRAGGETGAARYHLRRAPRTYDPPRPTKIVAATYEYASGCPSSNGFLLSIAPKAPAYRVEVGGRTWIVPDQPRGDGDSRHGTIVTGYVGCLDFNIPTDKPLALAVTPLRTDGRDDETRFSNCVRTAPPSRCWRDRSGEHCTISFGLSCGGVSWELSGAVKAIR